MASASAEGGPSADSSSAPPAIVCVGMAGKDSSELNNIMMRGADGYA
jgi:hypothetical protein